MILTVKSKSKTQLIDITDEINKTVHKNSFDKGFCFLFVPHTTAAITINESADPDVKTDILMILNKIVPWKADYRHMEGNSPAHVKATLIGASEMIAVENKELILGTWQGVFFCEFDGPRSRKVHIHFIKENTK